MAEDYIVFIVDDDARMQEALVELFASYGMPAMAFGSAGRLSYRSKSRIFLLA